MAGWLPQVCRGRLTTQVGRVKHVVDVAVKTVQDTSAAGNAAAAVQTDFLNEAVITWQVGIAAFRFVTRTRSSLRNGRQEGE